MNTEEVKRPRGFTPLDVSLTVKSQSFIPLWATLCALKTIGI
jgi:hypothetical protein